MTIPPIPRPGTVRFYVDSRRFIEITFDEQTATLEISSNQPIFCHQGPNSKQLRITSMPEDLTARFGDDEFPHGPSGA